MPARVHGAWRGACDMKKMKKEHENERQAQVQCGGSKIESAWRRSSDKRASAHAGATLPESSVEQRLDFLHIVDPEASLPERRQEVGNGQLALWLVAVSPQRGDGACAT